MCEEFKNEKKKEQNLPLPERGFENKKKKGQNNFDLPEQGFEPQIRCIFPTHDLNFYVK